MTGCGEECNGPGRGKRGVEPEEMFWFAASRRGVEPADAYLGTRPVRRFGRVELRQPVGADVRRGLHAARSCVRRGLLNSHGGAATALTGWVGTTWTRS